MNYVKHSLSALAITVTCGLAGLTGCSSSTETTPATTGKFSAPTTIDLGTIPVGQMRDTMIRISNTGNDSLRITGSAASSAALMDPGFGAGATILSGGYLDIRIGLMPSDTGRITAVDTIKYRTSGKDQTSLITVTARGIRTSPGVGSQFTYDVYDVDTNGVEGTHSEASEMIAATNVTYQGKSGVTVSVDDLGDSTYYRVEANGDVSTYIDFSSQTAGTPVTLQSGWYVIPFGSQTGTNIVLLDTSNVTIPGIPVPVNVKIVAATAGGGSASFTLGNKTFATQKASLTVTATLSALGGLITANQIQEQTGWFSPELMFYTKRDSRSQAAGSKRSAYIHQTLKAYTLQ